MKIPFLPIHITTDKTQKKIAAERKEGNRLIGGLLKNIVILTRANREYRKRLLIK